MFGNDFRSLLFAFIILISVTAQGLLAQGPGFQKSLKEQGHRIAPFCIPNTLENQQLIAQESIPVKFSSSEWLFISSTPIWIDEMIRKKRLDRFYFEYAPPSLMNDSTREKHFVDQVHQGLGLPSSYTGKNVLIGVVDTGLDYNHPDFQDSNGRTRVMYYWDQTVPNGSQTPQPYNYGQEWDSTDINNLAITSMDHSGHGTTVTGAAAANGRANGTNHGMAPDAKLVIVETDFNLPNWTMTVADACDYIFRIADENNMACVINLSIGTYLGSHDGDDPASEAMEDMVEAKPGRIIVCAAGNSGNWGPYHVEGQATNDTSFTWLIPNPNHAFGPNKIYFDLWCEGSFDNTMYVGFGADDTNYNFRGSSNFIRLDENVTVNPTRDTIYNDQGDKLADIEIYRSYQGSVFNMSVVYNVDSADYLYRFMTYGSGTYDLWSGLQIGANAIESDVPTLIQMPKIVDYNHPDANKTIVSSWNCSEKIISVGNFQNRSGYTTLNGTYYAANPETSVGEISKNSSRGPNRRGMIKPDVSASGDMSLSAGPLDFIQNPGNNGNTEQGGWHIRNGGTSMASPVVAGIAALYLERCPEGTYNTFKNLLISTSMSDNFTGTTPNNTYGFGKINALQLVSSVSIEPKPTISIDNGTLSSSPAINYQWVRNGEILAGETNQTLDVGPPNAEYQVYTVSSDGCPTFSDPFQTILGMKEVDEHRVVLVPNPARDKMVVLADGPIDQVLGFDHTGKQIKLPKIGEDTYDVSHLSAGYYQIKVVSGGSVLPIKMLRID